MVISKHMKEEYYSLPHKQIVNQPSLDNHMLPLQTGTGKLILSILSAGCLSHVWNLSGVWRCCWAGLLRQYLG